MPILKREAELKSLFTDKMKELLPGFFMMRLLDAGAPDRLISGLNKMTAWEFKHATPYFDSPGNQELWCMRLEATSFCRYVLWQEDDVQQHTCIVRPKNLHKRIKFVTVTDWREYSEYYCVGFDMTWLVTQVYEVHKGRQCDD